MMRIPIAILFLAVSASAVVSRDTPAEIAEIERAFAADAANNGWVSAFRRYTAPDGLLAGATLQPTVEALADAPADDRSLFWWPTFAGLARSGDLGFATGGFSVDAARTPRGQYFTVWRRQPDGAWKWIYDGGPGSVANPPAQSVETRFLETADRGAGSAAGAIAQVEAIEATFEDPAAQARHLSERALVYRRGRPLAEGGAAAVENLDYPYRPLSHRLKRAEASDAGDLVFTLGDVSWRDAHGGRVGYFARIWQYQTGDWRIVYDQIVELPPAAAGRSE